MAKFYTGKGDGGTTKFFGCDQKRVSKSSAVAEALGNLDELNSLLGVVKVHEKASHFSILDSSFSHILEEIQENIFIISAHIAGADKDITHDKTQKVESIIAECERVLPPITTFTLAGGTSFSALLDFARTLARRAERRVVSVSDEMGTFSSEILTYLNRLSSLLFALARLANFHSGVRESAPSYH
jgi:cob(I)alamin adenosyltransferase